MSMWLDDYDESLADEIRHDDRDPLGAGALHQLIEPTPSVASLGLGMRIQVVRRLVEQASTAIARADRHRSGRVAIGLVDEQPLVIGGDRLQATGRRRRDGRLLEDGLAFEREQGHAP